jgi:hypothetical protein
VLSGVDSEWTEDEIPAVEFSVVLTVPSVAINNREGNIYLFASAAGVMVSIEVDELGS